MCNKYIKEAKDCEIENLLYLRKLGVDDLIPNYSICDGKIVYDEETKLPVAALFDVDTFEFIYKDVLNKLYLHKSDKFSSGIYSYINKEYPLNRTLFYEGAYIEYLKKEFCEIVKKYNVLNEECERFSLLLGFHNLVINRFDRFSDYSVSNYSLLHGDLHTGNILYCKNENKYKMIDFEYLRFGMIELEVSNFMIQLLDGGEYVEKDFKDYINKILFQVSKFQKIDRKIIIELFFPLLLFFRLWRSLNEVNVKQTLVKNTVINVALDYLEGEYNECITDNSSI